MCRGVPDGGMPGHGRAVGAVEMKSLKDCTDEEILQIVKLALDEIRESPNQYGVITVTVSGGKVKFLTVEKPVV